MMGGTGGLARNRPRNRALPFSQKSDYEDDEDDWESPPEALRYCQIQSPSATVLPGTPPSSFSFQPTE